MRIEHIRTIAGPNLASPRPVLIVRLDPEELAGKECADLPGFMDRLAAALPSVPRANACRSLGHAVEQVCRELARREGISVPRAKTIRSEGANLCDIYVEYASEQAMRRLVEVSVEYVQSLIDGAAYPCGERMAEIVALARASEWPAGTAAIVTAAQRRGIPCTPLGDGGLLQLGHGRRRKFIRSGMSSQTSAVAVGATEDKPLAMALLARAGVPAARTRVVDSADGAVRAFEEFGGAVVVKPVDGSPVKGASADLCTAEQVCCAFEIARQTATRVVVEESFRGREYRVLVVNGRMLAACERIPASVTGDGKRSIQQLVEDANRDPRRGDGHDKPMRPIRIDRESVAALGKQGYRLENVASPGATVYLRENADTATGGSAIDVTDLVDPSMRLICERAARAIGLDICGVDLAVPDISQPFTEGGVVEVDPSPEIRMHHLPSDGQARDVASEIVSMLYPEGNGRIPIVSVTGANGTTTVTRLIAHILATPEAGIGMTAADGIWVGGTQIASGDHTGPQSATTVLFDPEVDVAVLETAPGGVAREGLGYDWSDVGVIVGAGGSGESNEAMRIQSLVAERVLEGGTLVLNAGDAAVCEIPRRPKVSRVSRKVVWFAPSADNLVLEAARRGGGTVYFEADGFILEASGANHRRVMQVDAIPMVSRGDAGFPIAHVMAAVAACRAMGTGVAQIRAALRTFVAGGQSPARQSAGGGSD